MLTIYSVLSSNIFKGTSGEPFAANVTSGVAIVEATKEVAVYFGCIVSPLRGKI